MAGRCVTQMTVCLNAAESWRLVSNCLSVSASSAEVASSNSRTHPFLSKALAMEMRWLWPSLRPVPCSPHMLSNPRGLCKTNSAHAVRNAETISSSVALGLPISRFSRTVPLSRVFPCGIYIRLLRVRAEMVSWWLSSYISKQPESGYSSASMRRISVVLPTPVSPKIAVMLPGGKSYVRLLIVFALPFALSYE